MKKNALGMGLSALMDIDDNESDIKNLTNLSVHALKPGKFQPRTAFDTSKLEELASSIKKNGVIQPIVVRPLEEGRYEIVAGERRWRAAQLAGLTEVPITIKELNDNETLQIALIENIQRQDLTAIEEAEGFKRLIEQFNYTQDQLSQVVGKSRSHIANLLRLLSLPKEVQALVNNGDLTHGHARALVNLDNAFELAKKIVSEGLSVRETERFAKGWGSHSRANDTAVSNQDKPTETKPKSKKSTKRDFSTPEGNSDPDLRDLEGLLSRIVSVPVTIDEKDGKGEIHIHFNNFADLDAIIAHFTSTIRD